MLLFTVKVHQQLQPRKKTRRRTEGGTMLELHRKERPWTTATVMAATLMEMMKKKTLRVWWDNEKFYLDIQCSHLELWSNDLLPPLMMMIIMMLYVCTWTTVSALIFLLTYWKDFSVITERLLGKEQVAQQRQNN